MAMKSSTDKRIGPPRWPLILVSFTLYLYAAYLFSIGQDEVLGLQVLLCGVFIHLGVAFRYVFRKLRELRQDVKILRVFCERRYSVIQSPTPKNIFHMMYVRFQDGREELLEFNKDTGVLCGLEPPREIALFYEHQQKWEAQYTKENVRDFVTGYLCAEILEESHA